MSRPEIKQIRLGNEIQIYCVIECPSSPRADIVLIHGLHDHSGRYSELSEEFLKLGLRVIRFDLRGFGRSTGKRGYINVFEEYVDDLKGVLGSTSSDRPRYAFGHSMGALILAKYLVCENHDIAGAVFSSGLFEVNPSTSPLLQRISGIASAIMPAMATVKIDASGLSRDSSIAKKAERDKLHYTGGVRARTGHEILKATEEIQDKLQLLKLPMLILHGEKDPITRVNASKTLFYLAQSEDKTLKIMDEAYHELFNELDKTVYFEIVTKWLDERMPALEDQ